MRQFLLGFILLFVTSSLFAQTSDNSLAFRRAEHLRHGINTSEWFAQRAYPGGYSQKNLETYTDLNDIALIKQLGFDHMRLSIDAAPLIAALMWHNSGSNYFVDELDKVVKAAQAQGLAVIVDIHPESDYKKQVREGGVGKFADLWRALARHYLSYPTDLTFFEVMNEPEDPDPNQWMGIQAQLVAAIRLVGHRPTPSITTNCRSEPHLQLPFLYTA